MSYSIGEVSNMTGISVSTLRYYDAQGFFPKIIRGNGGIREFSDHELAVLKTIDCLKSSGLSIKEIQHFFQLAQLENESLEARRDLFYQQKSAVIKQIEELTQTLNMIRYKCWYYDTAIELGDERKVQDIPTEKLPEDIRSFRY